MVKIYSKDNCVQCRATGFHTEGKPHNLDSEDSSL